MEEQYLPCKVTQHEYTLCWVTFLLRQYTVRRSVEAMTPITPSVNTTSLSYQLGAQHVTVRVGSQQWWEWLADENTTTFRFSDTVEASTSRSVRLGAFEKKAIEPTFKACGASKQQMMLTVS